jgi:hypothetical protein
MSTDTWTSKKFVLTLVIFLVGTIFVITGKADFNQWKSLCEWIFIGYLGANVGETAVNKIK